MNMQKTTIGILQFLLGSQSGQGGTAVTVAYPQQPQQQPQPRQTAVSTTNKPIIRRQQPRYTEAQKMQIAGMLASILERGLNRFDVVEQYGRVYLIRYVTINEPDPLLPFVFRDYGPSYRRGYQQLTNQLTAFAESPRYGWHYGAARRAADGLIACVGNDNDLHHDEVNYYSTRLMYAIAMPNRAL